ncbi:hypothetical protein ACOMHN_033335 [Nucella lapillus]
MAARADSCLPRGPDPTWHLTTGDEVSLKINCDVFHPDGRLKGKTSFSADRDSQLFTLAWPKLATKCVSTLSQWRLVITKASGDRVTSFNASTAEKLGGNQWEAVQKVVGDCREKFQSRLLSMSCREIVFAHEDRQSADRMKDSNEMVDIMNTLLADVEGQYCDIMVDWEVEVTPVNVSLSYRPAKAGEDQDMQFGSLILTDADSPPTVTSEESKTSSVSEVSEAVPSFQQLRDFVAAENKKTQDALQKMAEENTLRHRIICQKLEELKSCVRHLNPGYFSHGETQKKQNEMESNNARPLNAVEEEEEKESSIPSEELFERTSESDGGVEGDGEPATSPGQGDTTRKEPLQLQQQQGQLNPEVEQPNSSHHLRQFEEETISRSNQRQQDNQTSQDLECTRDVQGRDSVKPFDALRDTLSGSDLENHNLNEAVERAYRQDDVPPPKTKTYFTMLCLDVSESMKKNGAFDEMKQVVETFIDGVEEMVSTTGVEENLGVVTFGGTSTVVQNLTIDFSLVRDAIDNIKLGGRSPFVQALMVAFAAFVNKASIRCVSRMYDVRPRIIFISDGYPTENMDDGGADYAYDKLHVRSALTRLMVQLSTKEKYSIVKPVIYIPVGKDPDTELLKSMATLSNGVYMEPGEVKKLCGYFLAQETIGKTLGLLEREKDPQSQDHIRAVISGLMPDMGEDQKEEVVRAVMKEQESPSQASDRRGKSRDRKRDLEDMFEDTDKVNAGEMLPLGTRVVRGPDWKWKDQDGWGPGTVISHSDKQGWATVFWDATDNSNRYGFGPKLGYDIWRTDDNPRYMGEDQEMKIGMMVQKGTDQKTSVRWNNAALQVVRWGADDNRYDVMYCDPMEILNQAQVEFGSSGAIPAPSAHHCADTGSAANQTGSASVPDIENGRWQWKDEQQNWNDYSPEDSALIEKNYKKKPNGSCIVKREGKNRRVLFRRKTEKVVDSGSECPVQRIPV